MPVPDGRTDSRYDRRYLYLAGGLAAGGNFTRLGPNKNVSIPIPSAASVNLSMTGGLSEAKSDKLSVEYKKSHFPGVPSKLLGKLVGTKLFSLKSAKSLVRSESDSQNRRYQVTAGGEVKGVQVGDSFSLDYGALSLESVQAGDAVYPTITVKSGEITGLKLGKKLIKVTLDIDTINQCSTMEDLEKKFYAKKLPKTFSQSLTLDQKSGRINKNASSYSIGSIVKSIEGQLPEGAYIEPNGYVINWPAFGKIFLGEVLFNAYVRRVSLVRLKLCNVDIISYCTGGSYWPGG